MTGFVPRFSMTTPAKILSIVQEIWYEENVLMTINLILENNAVEVFLSFAGQRQFWALK